MATKMSNLPRELVEEVLCRIPMTSLRSVRSTCKRWNTLSKDRSFAKQHLGRQAKVAAEKEEFMFVLMMDFKVYLMSVNLPNTVESYIKREAKLISIDNADKVNVSQVFHCDGLLLCVLKDNGRLVVWNPYCGQTRWIEPTYRFSGILNRWSYALGYEKSNKSCSQKILVCIGCWFGLSPRDEFKIYDFNSDSWRILDVSLEWTIHYYHRGISLKGNTYWFAKGMVRGNDDTCLLCFDFTRERFGPRLPLPVEWYNHPGYTVILSSVREEQLAVLFQQSYSFMELWITTKIDPNEVSWNRKVFLEVNTLGLRFLQYTVSFLVDEEKKVAVVFDKEKDIAYIAGVDGSLRKVYLGESLSHIPLACSYVPSLL